MKCVICREGETVEGLTTVTVTRNDAIIFFKDVPALICSNCGEAYFTSKISRLLQTLTEDALKKGTELEVIRLKNVA